MDILPLIEVKDLWKSLGGFQVLKGLSLEIRRGETFVIIGKSGTGKSVTLKHIVGLLPPDKGAIFIGGEEITAPGFRDLARIRKTIGFLFQSGALINWMNVLDNVALPLREHTPMKEKAILEKVREKLDLVHMRGQEKKMPSQLSGGMRKRVALARALIEEPSIILYDEPTSGLDPVISRSINGLITELQEKLGVTSIVVTHHISSAMSIGDRIGMLHEGRLIEVGSPEIISKSTNPVVMEFFKDESGSAAPCGTSGADP
jgi:phospholipid/cholesterol/gamma-HCH transport system ATP-binding protein